MQKIFIAWKRAKAKEMGVAIQITIDAVRDGFSPKHRPELKGGWAYWQQIVWENADVEPMSKKRKKKVSLPSAIRRMRPANTRQILASGYKPAHSRQRQHLLACFETFPLIRKAKTSREDLHHPAKATYAAFVSLRRNMLRPMPGDSKKSMATRSRHFLCFRKATNTPRSFGTRKKRTSLVW